MTKKKVPNAVSQFNRITKAASLIGFDLQTTLKLAIRNVAIRKFIPPKTNRGKVTLHGVSFKEDIDGLAIHLHIPYSTKDRDFYRINEAWIVISDSLPVAQGKRYYREPLRCYGKKFSENIILHLRAIEWVVRHRPVAKSGKLMVPFRNHKGEFWWVDRSNGRIVEKENVLLAQ
jgi:hypothetical protein